MLNTDAFALHQIQNARALAEVFDPKLYRLFISTRSGSIKQQTAFIVRRTIPATRHPGLNQLNTIRRLRHGVDIEIIVGQHTIRLLSVYLKSFCFEKPLTDKDSDCEKLAPQVLARERWIDDRAANGTPFMVLGDFNRRFDKPKHDCWSEIGDGNLNELDLSRATDSGTSECWDGQYPHYIDHVVYDLQVSEWTAPGSFEQLVYTDPTSMKRLLSDHCPIAVTLDVPQRDPPKVDSRPVQLAEHSLAVRL